MSVAVSFITFEEEMPSLEAICRMASERSGLEIRATESLSGGKGEIMVYCEEIWQAVPLKWTPESGQIEFQWRNWWKGRDYLRLVLVKCMLDLGGKGTYQESFFRKKLFRTVAHSPYHVVKKLFFARLIGKFSLQLNRRYWKFDEELQKSRRQAG